MEIKKFYATNLPAAMRDIRRVLGPDAVILATRSLPPNTGIHLLDGRATVEVTAAREADPGAQPPVSQKQNIKKEAALPAPMPRPTDRAFRSTPAPAKQMPVSTPRVASKQSIVSSLVSEIKSLKQLLGEKANPPATQLNLENKKTRGQIALAAEPAPISATTIKTNLIEPKPRSFDTRVSAPPTKPKLIEEDETDIFAELEEAQPYELSANLKPDPGQQAESKPSAPSSPAETQSRSTQFSPHLIFSGEQFLKLLSNQGMADELIKRILARMRFMSDDRAPTSNSSSRDSGVSIRYGEFTDIVKGLLPPSPAAAEAKPRKIALVGPTGVGKTTTLAKLASRSSLYENRKVGLITMDTYRIAAADQLKTYARLLGVPLEVVNDQQELQAAFDRFADADEIYVDTAGYSPRDTRGIERMAAALNQHPDLEVDLLITCATRDYEMRRIMDRFQSTGFDRLIFTKMDEASTVGDLINTWIMGGYPVSYFTTGQRVPEDLEMAMAEPVCQRLLSPIDL